MACENCRILQDKLERIPQSPSGELPGLQSGEGAAAVAGEAVAS